MSASRWLSSAFQWSFKGKWICSLNWTTLMLMEQNLSLSKKAILIVSIIFFSTKSKFQIDHIPNEFSLSDFMEFNH
jgi:hypothetical protein